MSKLPIEKLQNVSAAAKDVIDTLAGNGDYSASDDSNMVRLYDYLNDVAAPPAVVKAMADELINLRLINESLKRQRIADRRAFSNPKSELAVEASLKAEEAKKCLN